MKTNSPQEKETYLFKQQTLAFIKYLDTLPTNYTNEEGEELWEIKGNSLTLPEVLEQWTSKQE